MEYESEVYHHGITGVSETFPSYEYDHQNDLSFHTGHEADHHLRTYLNEQRLEAASQLPRLSPPWSGSLSPQRHPTHDELKA